MTECRLLAGLELAQEETEAGQRKPDSHQAQACPNPRQERTFGGKVGAGIFEFGGHVRTWMVLNALSVCRGDTGQQKASPKARLLCCLYKLVCVFTEAARQLPASPLAPSRR